MIYLCARRIRSGLTLLAALGWVSACQPAEQTEVAAADDYEHHPNTPWVTQEKAHAGTWSSRIMPHQAYGPSITRSWELLGNPTRLRISAWLMLPNGRVGVALVLEAKHNDKVMYYHVLPIEQVVKRYNQWELMQHTYTLPETMVPADVIKVYLWQNGQQRGTIYMDDLVLEKIF